MIFFKRNAALTFWGFWIFLKPILWQKTKKKPKKNNYAFLLSAPVY
jgi:hypothetical protein